jgi:hypothetical protein
VPPAPSTQRIGGMGPGVCFIMARMKKTAALLFFLVTGTAFASSLDIGTDYRLRGIDITKADYGLSPNQDYSFYYSQRAEAHVGGKFSPNLEFMTQFQALGVAGSTGSVSNVTVNPGASRYPNTNFSPWIQWAYIKASHLYDSPVDLTIGRQPITLGDGFILSDDDLGFTGIRMDDQLPWYDMRANLFAFKPGQNLSNTNSSIDIYGLEVTKPTRNVRYQMSIVNERDASGSSVYIRPSENASPFSSQVQARSITPSQYAQMFNFTATNITKTFLDARVEGRLLEGGFFKAEAALQTGHVSRDPSLGTSTATALGYSQDVKLGGYAFLVSAGLFTRFSKYGPIEIHGLFGLASGDSGGGTDSSFHPDYGHQYDGLERSGFGEFYGATLYNAIPSSSYNSSASSPTVSGLPPGNSGLRVIGAGVTTHPTSLLSFGIDYFVYTAEQSAVFAPANSESSLGTELDFGAGFAYTNYITFRLTYAIFSPGKAYGAFENNATRLALEAVGRF